MLPTSSQAMLAKVASRPLLHPLTQCKKHNPEKNKTKENKIRNKNNFCDIYFIIKN